MPQGCVRVRQETRRKPPGDPQETPRRPQDAQRRPQETPRRSPGDPSSFGPPSKIQDPNRPVPEPGNLLRRRTRQASSWAARCGTSRRLKVVSRLPQVRLKAASHPFRPLTSVKGGGKGLNLTTAGSPEILEKSPGTPRNPREPPQEGRGVAIK